MFEKSDLVPAEAASVGHVADDPVSKDTSSRTLSRHDSRLTAMMDDQPDEDYWYDFLLPVLPCVYILPWYASECVEVSVWIVV